MIPTNTATKCFGFFQDFAGMGVSGLTVTIDILNADGTLLVSAGSCTETLITGLYVYPYTFTAEGLYPYVMSTVSTAVASQEIVGLWRVDNILWNLTHTAEGEPASIVIPPPDGPHTCRVWERCYDQASQTPLTTVTATAQIIRLYDFDEKLHDIQVVDGTLSDPDLNGDRFVYWDIVQGSTVTITIEETGIVKRGTVPALATVRVSDL